MASSVVLSPVDGADPAERREEKQTAAVIAFNLFFWLLLVLGLGIAIIARYVV